LKNDQIEIYASIPLVVNETAAAAAAVAADYHMTVTAVHLIYQQSLLHSYSTTHPTLQQ